MRGGGVAVNVADGIVSSVVLLVIHVVNEVFLKACLCCLSYTSIMRCVLLTSLLQGL